MHIGDQPSRIFLHTWSGHGPAAMLIHGIGSSGASWASLVSALQSRLTPHALDLRGHGLSDHPASGYLYAEYVADLDDALRAINAPQPVLIGHSLGGIVALWWAARNPAAAQAVIALDTPLRSGEAFRPAFDAWIAQNALPVEELTQVYLERDPDWSLDRARRRAETMTSTAPDVFHELKADSLRHEGADRIAELTAIQSPVLLIRGDPAFGSMVDPADAQSLVARLPHAEVAFIPEAGHSPHRQFPAEVIATIISFLDRCGVR